MEPLLPDFGDSRLAELSKRVFVEAGALGATLPAERTRVAVAALVREMNSCYSNLIEGHKTYPRDIEDALRNTFYDDAEKRLNQHLGRSHMHVQEEMEQRLTFEPNLDVYDSSFVKWLHDRFYEHLPPEASTAYTVSGREYRIEKGVFRTFNVDVGVHTPPDYVELDVLMARFREVYADNDILPTNALSAIAAAHHRFAWIHPFGDGNGRIARLQSHAALLKQGIGSLGLWTLSRGLARNRSAYYAALSRADQPRMNDYDGRGPLSARGLHDFCEFFLETILDQITFMGRLLELPSLLRRVEDYVYRESGILKHRERVVRLLSAAITEGEVARGNVPGIVGLKPSAARQVTRLCLDQGLLASDTPKGPVHAAFPAKVLDAYFPRLFLDLPA